MFYKIVADNCLFVIKKIHFFVCFLFPISKYDQSWPRLVIPRYDRALIQYVLIEREWIGSSVL